MRAAMAERAAGPLAQYSLSSARSASSFVRAFPCTASILLSISLITFLNSSNVTCHRGAEAQRKTNIKMLCSDPSFTSFTLCVSVSRWLFMAQGDHRFDHGSAARRQKTGNQDHYRQQSCYSSEG